MFPTKNNDGKIIGMGAILILSVGGFLLFQRFWGSSATKNQITPTPYTTPEKNDFPTLESEIIRQKILNNEKVLFLDFRDPESFTQEHIPHALSFSPGTFTSFVPEKDELLVAILPNQDTNTAETIKGILRQKPYKVFLLEGGFEAWKKGGNQVISYGDPTSLLDQSKVVFITQEEIQKSDLDFVILDVQTAENYQTKHVAGALHIPLDQLEKRSQEIPGTKNIIVYGENEVISFQGAVRLAGLNILTARALLGNTHLQPESIFLLEP